jgi:hypothetical protein
LKAAAVAQPVPAIGKILNNPAQGPQKAEKKIACPDRFYFLFTRKPEG